MAAYGEYTISANQSIPDRTQTTIVLNQVTIDNDRFELMPDGRIRVLKSGIYFIDTFVVFPVNNTGLRRSFLFLGGISYKNIVINTIQNLSTSVVLQDLSYLNANTIIEFQAWQNSNGALDVTTASKFKIKYMGG